MTDNEKRAHDLTIFTLDIRARNGQGIKFPDDYVEIYHQILPKIEESFPPDSANNPQSVSQQS